MSIQDQVRAFLADVKKEYVVVCTRTSVFRSMVKDLRDIAMTVDVLCNVPEDAEVFQAVLGSARAIVPLLGNDSFTMTYIKVFKQTIAWGDDRYRAEMLIIADGVRSLLTYEMNDEIMALLFEPLFIVILQHSAIIRLIK